MIKWMLTLLLTIPLCGTGQFNEVSFPVLYADAHMKIYECQIEIDHVVYEDATDVIVLLYAGRPKEIIKALTWVDYTMATEGSICIYPEVIEGAF